MPDEPIRRPPPSRASFARISSVDPADPQTWEEKLFLTFDLDWAADAVIADTLDLIEPLGIEATWFVTHDTPVLERLRGNPLFELGIHPNFNFLLAGDPRNGANAEDVLDRLLAIVPEAKSVRSHSLVQGGRLLQLFRAKGLTHESNAFIPEQSGILLKPWVDWFGMIKVPYFWEDDFCCEAETNTPVEDLVRRPGVRGFDFHPIHVFLNTEDLDRYERARGVFNDPSALAEHRGDDPEGTRSILQRLVETCR